MRLGVEWSRLEEPLTPAELAANYEVSRNFAVGNAVTLTAYAGLGAASFFIAIYLQQVCGYSAFAAGLVLEDVHFDDHVKRGDRPLHETLEPLIALLVPGWLARGAVRADRAGQSARALLD